MFIKPELLKGKVIAEAQIHYKKGDEVDGLGLVFTDGTSVYWSPRFTDVSEGQTDYPFIRGTTDIKE